MTLIQGIRAREILDSRGYPTLEAELITNAGPARALVPAGTSIGKNEALELRDKEKRYFGRGVRMAVHNVKKLSFRLQGMEIPTQANLDAIMNEEDGTENKSRIGANVILAVSMAFSRVQARENGVPLYQHVASLAGSKPRLPIPQMNILNGGKHAGFENDLQEHLIMPRGSSFSRSLEMGVEVYHRLKENLKEKYGSSATHVADEGGFAPKELEDTRVRLDAIMQAVNDLGYHQDIRLGLDAAATEFHYFGRYTLGSKDLSVDKLIDFYQDLESSYPLASLEDGLAEGDWNSWVALTRQLGERLALVGDDLLATNPKLVEKAVRLKACNALLVKMNQVGTITETLEAVRLAREAGWPIIVSHRSGETEDPFIADLAVGLGADYCKFGAPARGERTLKYNQLLRIEEQLTKS